MKMSGCPFKEACALKMHHEWLSYPFLMENSLALCCGTEGEVLELNKDFKGPVSSPASVFLPCTAA